MAEKNQNKRRILIKFTNGERVILDGVPFGTLALDSTGEPIVLKNNYGAAGAPTGTDDVDAGFAVGSEWETGGVWYKLSDASAGAAVWDQLN